MKKIFLLMMVVISFTTFAQEHVVPGLKFPLHMPDGSAVKKIRLDTGVELEYTEKGNKNGRPVILLHGITDSRHSFDLLLPLLPSNLRVFAISQRGHGNSDKPAGAYTPKQFASDIASFVHQLNLEPVIIVGHSMGGVNAMRFAIDYPQFTRALVILSSDPFFIRNPGMPAFLQQCMQLQDPLSRDFMEEFQSSTIANPLDSSYYNLIVQEGLKVSARVFKSALHYLMKEDFCGQLQRISIPALVLWGDQDAVCHSPGQALMVSQLPDCRFIPYEGIGHAIHWEAPGRVASDLSEFINEIKNK